MQRLFSMFPTGAVGAALLLLRLSVAATLVFHTARHWLSDLPTWTIGSIALVVVLLVVGAFTPLMSALCGLIESILLSRVSLPEWPFLLLSIGYATSLALLGPGAYSFDGGRFGRRLIVTSSLGMERQNGSNPAIDPSKGLHNQTQKALDQNNDIYID